MQQCQVAGYNRCPQCVHIAGDGFSAGSRLRAPKDVLLEKLQFTPINYQTQ